MLFVVFRIRDKETKTQKTTTMARIYRVILLILLCGHVESRFFIASTSKAHRPNETRQTKISDERHLTQSVVSVAGGAAKKYMSARKMETLQ